MEIELSNEQNVRKAYRLCDGELLRIPPRDIDADMVICLFEPNGNPVVYENRVFFVVKKKFVTDDGIVGFEFE